MRLSVIIPAYNEEANLKSGSLDQVYGYMRNQQYSWEVLIVDDGSKDKTADIIESQIKNKKGFKLLRNPHGGKAITVMTGLLKSQGEIALFTDMDQATPIGEVEKILPKFDDGYDIVIGSRSGRKGAPFVRKLMAWGFATLRGLILGLPFKDTQCGFKAFKREVVDDIFPGILKKWEGMKSAGAAVNAGFDIETLFVAKNRGYKIAEVVIEWHHVGTEKVQAFGDSLEALKDMIRIRVNR